jgi:hypothetical protein
VNRSKRSGRLAGAGFRSDAFTSSPSTEEDRGEGDQLTSPLQLSPARGERAGLVIPLEPITLMFTHVEALETAPEIVKLYESPGKAGGLPVIN